MLFRRHLRLRYALLTLAALVAAAPVHAAELDKFLPADTEIYFRFGVRQALDSGLVKKLGLDQIKDLVKQVEELDGAFKELEFDPFSDIQTVTVAAPNGNEPDRLLVIVHGKYKLDKFKAKGEDLAKNMGDVVKLHKVGDGAGGKINVYEVNFPGGDEPLFFALPNETTLLVSPGKDYVADAIKRDKAKGPVVLKNKAFQALLEKMNPKQTLAVAAIGAALAKSAGDTPVKDTLAKIDAIGGGITLADDVKLEIVLGARTAPEAKELKETLDDYATKGIAFVGLLATQDKKLAPVVDVLKTIRCTAKDKAVTIKLDISADVIEAIQKALAGN